MVFNRSYLVVDKVTIDGTNGGYLTVNAAYDRIWNCFEFYHPERLFNHERNRNSYKQRHD